MFIATVVSLPHKVPGFLVDGKTSTYNKCHKNCFHELMYVCMYVVLRTNMYMNYVAYLFLSNVTKIHNLFIHIP